MNFWKTLYAPIYKMREQVDIIWWALVLFLSPRSVQLAFKLHTDFTKTRSWNINTTQARLFRSSIRSTRSQPIIFLAELIRMCLKWVRCERQLSITYSSNRCLKAGVLSLISRYKYLVERIRSTCSLLKLKPNYVPDNFSWNIKLGRKLITRMQEELQEKNRSPREEARLGKEQGLISTELYFPHFRAWSFWMDAAGVWESSVLSVSIPHPALYSTSGYIIWPSSDLPPVKWECALFCRLEFMVHAVPTLEHFWQIKTWAIAFRANNSLFITQKRNSKRERSQKQDQWSIWSWTRKDTKHMLAKGFLMCSWLCLQESKEKKRVMTKYPPSSPSVGLKPGLFLGLFSLEGEVLNADFCLKAQDTL